MDLIVAVVSMFFMYFFLQVLKPVKGDKKILLFQILASITFGFVVWGLIGAIVLQKS